MATTVMAMRWLRAHLRDGVVAVHLALTAVMFWWAFDLALPGDTFGSSPSYGFFVRHGPGTETGWAGLFLLAGIIGLAGLIVRGRWLRLVCAVALGMAHGDLAVAVYQGNPVGTGTGAYAIYALLGLWRIWAEGLL